MWLSDRLYTIPFTLDLSDSHKVNLGTSHEIKIIDLAQWINELTENPGGIVYNERRSWDKKSRLFSSIDKFRRVIGYQPKTDFKMGLSHTYNWFTENRTTSKNQEF